MALEYCLYLDDDSPPGRVRELFVSATSEPGAKLEEDDGWTFLPSPGPLGVWAGPVTGLRQQILSEELGVGVRVYLSMRLNKEDSINARHRMLRGVREVLARLSGDAVLLFNGDSVHLCRQKSILYLQSRAGVWSESELKLVRLPFEWRLFADL